jgi:hypothetical protein
VLKQKAALVPLLSRSAGSISDWIGCARDPSGMRVWTSYPLNVAVNTLYSRPSDRGFSLGVLPPPPFLAPPPPRVCQLTADAGCCRGTHALVSPTHLLGESDIRTAYCAYAVRSSH